MAPLVAIATLAALWLVLLGLPPAIGEQEPAGRIGDVGNRGSALVEGQVVDATGAPVADAVVSVSAWPDDRLAEPGETVQFVPVATTRTDADGRFTARSQMTPRLAAIAANTGGLLNLEVAVRGREMETSLTEARVTNLWNDHLRDARAQHGKGRAAEQLLERASEAAWGRTPDDMSVDVTPVVLDPSLPGVMLIADRRPQPYSGGLTVEGYTIAETEVDQHHTPRDTDEQSGSVYTEWKYSSSTEDRVATTYKYGLSSSWSISGMSGLVTYSGSTTGWAHGSNNYSGKVITDMKYQRGHIGTPYGVKYVMRAVEWIGNTYMDTSVWDSNCQSGSFASHKISFIKGAQYERAGANTFYSGSAASIGWKGATANFSIQTGFQSASSSGHYQGIAMGWVNDHHWLCGSNASPHSNPQQVHAD